jgi:hypothetical protein
MMITSLCGRNMCFVLLRNHDIGMAVGGLRVNEWIGGENLLVVLGLWVVLATGDNCKRGEQI